jgi:hypothetical protein
MIELASDREFSSALTDAVLLGLWAIPPGLTLAYIRQSAALRQTLPEFALRKSEAAEWDRAVALYSRVLQRIADVDARRVARKLLHRVLFGSPAELAPDDAGLFDDLKAHAAHLRAAVVRLNRQPLDRLKAWVHGLSVRFALGYAVAAYLVGLTLLIATAALSERWLGMPAESWVPLLLWCPLGPVVCANALSIAFALLAGPVAYLLRRVALRREYRFEFRLLKDLAQSDPDGVERAEQSGAIHLNDELEILSIGPEEQRDCFEILGLPPSASMEELRAAYKRLIKQYHPDRVYGLAPAFTKLAEAQTRRLNAAYQQALIAVVPEAAGA